VHSALIDHFDEDELRFVIGHETGHIQNKHVVYGTVLILLKQSAAAILKLLMPPVDVALNSWYRRAEITCDRAGLLCCQDLDAACRTFVKLACGSQKLYREMDLVAYAEQADEGRGGVGRFAELFVGHPYLPKRMEAMQLFAESALYREAHGTGPGGLTMEEVDARTSEIIQVVKGRKHNHGEAA
jgi:Zn-dependent protease with chaperone function